MSNFHEFGAKTIDGEDKSLAEFKGQVLLVVNVASECGFTPQYADLEKLYRENKDADVTVLGFPCNQFGAQEPGSDEDIKNFCSTKFDVTFPMFSKIDVNGPNAHPVYQWLTSQNAEPEGSGDIGWNFVKFVVDTKGQVVARFGAATKPNDSAVMEALAEAKV